MDILREVRKIKYSQVLMDDKGKVGQIKVFRALEV